MVMLSEQQNVLNTLHNYIIELSLDIKARKTLLLLEMVTRSTMMRNG